MLSIWNAGLYHSHFSYNVLVSELATRWDLIILLCSVASSYTAHDKNI